VKGLLEKRVISAKSMKHQLGKKDTNSKYVYYIKSYQCGKVHLT